MEINKLQQLVPQFVNRTADVLIENGFEAYLVGGAVRDIILGRTPKDYDLATNAVPEQIEALFPKSVTTNAKFGTVLVIMEDKAGERFDVEVTTFRKDEEYIGGRWPSKVEFTSSIKDDLARRDFTINAIAINLKYLFQADASVEEVVIDPFGGQEDITNKLIRAVGKAIDRFGEDGLRAFKACRLASELQFEIESETFEGIKKCLHIAAKISMERIRDELLKLLKYSVKPSQGIELMRKSGLLELFLPELIETIGVTQPEWHTDDVYTHSLKSLDLAEDDIKLAALLHDIGKARTRSEDETGIHFYSHDVIGANMAKEVLTRLRFSNKVIDRVSSLIRWHMFYYPSADWRKENDLKVLEHDLSGGWTDAAIRRFVKNVGEDLIDDLFKLRIADANANPKSAFDPKEIQALEKRIAEVRAKDMVNKLSDLNINGQDLLALGIIPGPQLGKVLNELLDYVVDDPLNNKKDILLARARHIMSTQ